MVKLGAERSRLARSLPQRGGCRRRPYAGGLHTNRAVAPFAQLLVASERPFARPWGGSLRATSAPASLTNLDFPGDPPFRLHKDCSILECPASPRKGFGFFSGAVLGHLIALAYSPYREKNFQDPVKRDGPGVRHRLSAPPSRSEKELGARRGAQLLSSVAHQPYGVQPCEGSGQLAEFSLVSSSCWCTGQHTWLKVAPAVTGV